MDRICRFFAMNLIGREGKFYCSFLLFFSIVLKQWKNNGSLFSVNTFCKSKMAAKAANVCLGKLALSFSTFIFCKSKMAANAANACVGTSALFPSALFYFPQIQDGGKGSERMRGIISTFSISNFLFSSNPRWWPRQQAHVWECQHFFHRHFYIFRKSKMEACAETSELFPSALFRLYLVRQIRK